MIHITSPSKLSSKKGTKPGASQDVSYGKEFVKSHFPKQEGMHILIRSNGGKGIPPVLVKSPRHESTPAPPRHEPTASPPMSTTPSRARSLASYGRNKARTLSFPTDHVVVPVQNMSDGETVILSSRPLTGRGASRAGDRRPPPPSSKPDTQTSKAEATLNAQKPPFPADLIRIVPFSESDMNDSDDSTLKASSSHDSLLHLFNQDEYITNCCSDSASTVVTHSATHATDDTNRHTFAIFEEVDVDSVPEAVLAYRQAIESDTLPPLDTPVDSVLHRSRLQHGSGGRTGSRPTTAKTSVATMFNLGHTENPPWTISDRGGQSPEKTTRLPIPAHVSPESANKKGKRLLVQLHLPTKTMMNA